jgi:hypothetical protein
VVQIAVKRPDLGPSFAEWLTNYVTRDLGATTTAE